MREKGLLYFNIYYNYERFFADLVILRLAARDEERSGDIAVALETKGP